MEKKKNIFDKIDIYSINHPQKKNEAEKVKNRINNMIISKIMTQKNINIITTDHKYLTKNLNEQLDKIDGKSTKKFKSTKKEDIQKKYVELTQKDVSEILSKLEIASFNGINFLDDTEEKRNLILKNESSIIGIIKDHDVLRNIDAYITFIRGGDVFIDVEEYASERKKRTKEQKQKKKL